jgi:DNA-binding NtrC family response regulator
VLPLAPAALEDLYAYAWPGNVRELQNCIERAVILCEGDAIQTRHLNLSFRVAAPLAESASAWDQVDLSGTLAEALRRATTQVERRKIEHAMKEAAGNTQRAADVLLIGHKVLLQKLKEYRLEP